MIKLVTLSALFLVQAAIAQTKTEKLDSLFIAVEKDSSFNGNVLIAEKGKVIYERSVGYADFKTKEKLKFSSLFV